MFPTFDLLAGTFFVFRVEFLRGNLNSTNHLFEARNRKSIIGYHKLKWLLSSSGFISVKLDKKKDLLDKTIFKDIVSPKINIRAIYLASGNHEKLPVKW